MTEEQQFLIALFVSVSHVIRSEKILIELKIPHKIIPVPKKISTECGVCIRFLPENREAIEQALEGKTEISDIRPL